MMRLVQLLDVVDDSCMRVCGVGRCLGEVSFFLA